MSAVPKPPSGLKRSGRSLWTAVLTDFDLSEHEVTVLREACRTADSIDLLQTTVDNDGVMSESSQGIRVHPALVELRQQRITFARLLAAMRVPLGEEEGGGAGAQQYRGPRGAYGPRSVAT